MRQAVCGGLGHVPATVHADGVAGHVGAFGKEHGNAADLIWAAENAHGNSFAGGVRIAGDHVGRNQGGSNRVYGDSLLREQGRIGMRQADQAGFRSGIVRANDSAGLSCDSSGSSLSVDSLSERFIRDPCIMLLAVPSGIRTNNKSRIASALRASRQPVYYLAESLH